MPRRLGIYESSPGPSGPSRYVESILAALDPQEFEVVLFGHAHGPYRARPGATVATVCDSEAPRGASPSGRLGSTSALGRPRLWRRFAPRGLKLCGGTVRDCVQLARCLRRWPVDLLHTNDTGCEESAVAARLAGVPNVLGTFHVDPTYDLDRQRSGFTHRALECLSNHCLHRAIAVSEATKREWVRRTHLPAHRIVAIHNGIDPDRFQRLRERGEARQRLGLPVNRGLLLGGVGRLERAKGFAYLIDALARLGDGYQHVSLVLAGQGPERCALEERARQHGLGSRVHFLGFCPNVQFVYDALDIFVLPSLCEALPYALLEAMATALPAVGTAVGGVPEVIVPAETGFVVPPRNPFALASALRPLLDSADLRQRLGTAGRRRVQRDFDNRTMVRRTVQLYRDLLTGHV